MTAPAPTATVVGGPLTLTYANPTGSVVVTDTKDSYTPEATARDVVVGVTTVKDSLADAESTVEFLTAGTFPVKVTVTNDDDTASSTPVNVVVTDDIADNLPAYEPGTTRIKPHYLPPEYRDAQIATPGLPSALGIANARSGGAIGDVDVIVDGKGIKVALA